ncbi:MAG: hypothetical protein R3244_05780 [Thermoanaerobaculia bacterium]|nr:hypothetical protein [Thermoanaerobaculia bacterium]
MKRGTNDMDHDLDRDLLRLLSGELEPERASRLERAIDADPALRRRWEEWRDVWRGLELPPPEPVDLLPAIRRRLAQPGTQRGAAAEARTDAGPGEMWRVAPAWGRALAAAALAFGVGLGVWLGDSALASEESLPLEAYEPSLAESYWTEAPWTSEQWSEVESSDGDAEESP